MLRLRVQKITSQTRKRSYVYHLIDAIIVNGMSRSKYIFLDTDTLKVVNGRVRVSNLALLGEI